ncbi:MAG: rRNA maturation RNase YbeY [Candidatus Falkowbacteria bacterium]
MIEINNKTKTKINLALVKKIVEKFFRVYKINKNISIAFVGDKVIKNLNNKYRKINKITDILSFNGEDDFLGELVIDYAQIKRQAKKFGNSEKQELIFILVHGLLHLIGHEDKTENGRLKMEKIGNEFINKL